MYRYHGFLIHSSANGHLGCFHVLDIANSAVMNIWVHTSLSILVSSVCMPSSGIAGLYGSSSSSFLFIFFISWRLITLQYCSGYCHTLTRISHGFTCIPHPHSPSHLPPHPIPLGLPSAPALSTCLMHPTWAGDLFH